MQAKSLQHLYVMDLAIHFWGMELPSSDAQACRLHYPEGPFELPSMQYIVAGNTSLLSADKIVFKVSI